MAATGRASRSSRTSVDRPWWPFFSVFFTMQTHIGTMHLVTTMLTSRAHRQSHTRRAPRIPKRHGALRDNARAESPYLPPQYDIAMSSIGYRALLASAAFLIASFLSLTFSCSAPAFAEGHGQGGGRERGERHLRQAAYEVATEAEDKLLGVVRTLETKADTLATAVASAVVPQSRDGDGGEKETAIRELIDEVYDVVAQNFDDSRRKAFSVEDWKSLRDAVAARRIRDPALAHSAIREMVLRLKDPYSRFLSPSEFSAMSKYDISGVGLNLGTKTDLKEKTGLVPAFEDGDGAWVIGLIRDSPADSAGIRQGDLILQIGGRGLDEKSPFEVASLFQGQGEESDEDLASSSAFGLETEWFGISRTVSKPPVKLRVRHLDGGEEDLDLRRPAVVPTPSPVSARFDSKKRTGYIKLSSFNARAHRDISSAVSDLVGSKGATTIVLDLRGNRGGLVSEGIEVAKVFLSNDDVIVRSRIKARQNESVVRATNNAPLTDAKLIVLVDGGTASASEIVAGALQDNCRAPLVGQNTYGKGLIQSVYELSDGSGLVLTVGKYLTPLGTDIDYSGLRPDFGGQPDDRKYQEGIRACLVRKNRSA